MFNQDSATLSLKNKPLKLVDQFTYLGSNISPTESDVNTRIGKAWNAIIMWKSDFSDKIEREFY